jgi:ubiquinone/menaquinone biosynthesis C-methylase UbiE
MNKLKSIVQLLRANGIYWFMLYLAERAVAKTTPFFFHKRTELEIRRKLPGFNTKEYNYKEWSNYDWSREGEEWTDSEPWKKALVEELIIPYIKPGSTVLEIGPGGGRWSVILAGLSARLILVDMTEKAIEHCKKKLQTFSNCVFYRNNGTDLSFLTKGSVDCVWSFDVFVHIAPEDVEHYLEGLSNIMVNNGIGVIHHPSIGGVKGGFRSSVTNELFCLLLKKNNFEIVRQLDTWGKNKEFSVHDYRDMITVFKKI